MIQGRFRPVLAFSFADRYDLIRPIWPDAAPMRGQPRRTPVRHPSNHADASELFFGLMEGAVPKP